jgi:hypothetical protein
MRGVMLLMRRSALRSLGFVRGANEKDDAPASLNTGRCCLAYPLVIAGLDPAIHLLRKRMDARVKPAHDERREAWLFDI